MGRCRQGNLYLCTYIPDISIKVWIDFFYRNAHIAHQIVCEVSDLHDVDGCGESACLPEQTNRLEHELAVPRPVAHG